VFRLSPHGAPVAVLQDPASRRPWAALDPPARLRRPPARRRAGRAPAAPAARDGQRSRRGCARLRDALRPLAALAARAPPRSPRPPSNPVAPHPARALRTPRPPSCDPGVPRPFQGTPGARAARWLCDPLDPPAGETAHRGGGNPLRPHRTRGG